MKSLLLCIVCFLSLGLTDGYGQRTPADTPQEVFDQLQFENAVERHRDEFSSFKGARGGVFGNDPRIYSFKQSLPRLTVPNLARVIREDFAKDTAILFYNYDDGKLRAWVIDHEGIKGASQSVVSLEKLQTAIAGLRRSFGIEKLQKARAPELRTVIQDAPVIDDKTPVLSVAQAVASLSVLLLPQDIAKALGQTRSLIVVPILEIGTVPFAVLQPFGTDEILIDRMSISFAPSLFDLTAEKPAAWSAKFTHPLIVGNPKFTDKTRWRIPALPGAEEEATVVAGMLQTQPLIGAAATKQKVLAQVVDADMLYFATHGVSDSRSTRNNSFLVFGSAENDFGFWTMAEILDAHQKWGVVVGNTKKTPLTARLAVLSACQTGTGEAWKGGVMSLGRSLQSSGVPRVVMSLWNVSDRATVDLMRSFVGRLQTEIPAEALRQSMLETRKKYPSPAHWAPFVYFGLPY
jgi:CHAT domain-containing protein